jgi:transposase InsO family protein
MTVKWSSVQNGLLFKSGRIVVPQTLREDMTKGLHSSHLGVEGCLRRAREILYWPKMSSKVKELVSKCSVCNMYQPKQCKEPLLSRDSPALPWSKVGVDLFIYENRNYVITVDYFSNFFEVDYLTSNTTTAVVKKLKEQFSRHGIPETVFTDNGPQFVCKEFREFSN